MNAARGSPAEPLLVALLDGRVVGAVHRNARSRLVFRYDEAWRTNADSYPVSLSMPLAAAEHTEPAVDAYLWGLLPDNDRTLDHYARTFGVSSRNPVALLAHIGADCAGAIQLVPPERVSDIEGQDKRIRVEWIDEEEVGRELKSVKETGLPGKGLGTVGRFSLAGAQPKIALFHRNEKWGRPLGRTPTTHILKPPLTEYARFAENEHLCLDLASELGLGAAQSTVRRFAGEVAIVIERFDRAKTTDGYRRIHQEDMCQALSVLPWKKYENEGGPGVSAIVTLIRESSFEPDADIGRLIDALALNWVLAAPDGHAKNYAFLHLPGGDTRLAPFYDIASVLPYTDERLHEVKLGMRVGKQYAVRKIALADWKTLASSTTLSPAVVVGRLEAILARIPATVDAVARRSVDQGLDAKFIRSLAARIAKRSRECLELLSMGKR